MLVAYNNIRIMHRANGGSLFSEFVGNLFGDRRIQINFFVGKVVVLFPDPYAIAKFISLIFRRRGLGLGLSGLPS